MDDQETAQVLPFYKAVKAPEASAHIASHRRSEFLKRLILAGADTATDAEILETILPTSAHAEALAVRLIERFGTLNQLVNADLRQLREIEGVDDSVIDALMVARQITLRVLRSEVTEQPVIDRWSALLNYCRFASGQDQVEELRVMFLNQSNMLIADEVMFRGTANHAPIYPREVVKRALELSASAIVLVRSRPNYQQVAPSKPDIDVTINIILAAADLLPIN